VPHPKYDRQVIVQLGFEAEVTQGAVALNKYGKDRGIPSEIVAVRRAMNGTEFDILDVAKLTQALKGLSPNSRVYLQGHGNWMMQHLASYTADQVAGLLISCGLPAVKLISILGCQCGRDLGTADNARIGDSMNSFGSKFHKALNDKGGLRVNVYARIFNVGIGTPQDEPGWKVLHGRKATTAADKFVGGEFCAGMHRPNSKLLFFWSPDGRQYRLDAYIKDGVKADVLDSGEEPEGPGD
jgi:hypothetical protein